jgi:hypothetical protein
MFFFCFYKKKIIYNNDDAVTYPYKFDYPCKELAKIRKQNKENWNTDNGVNDCEDSSHQCPRRNVSITCAVQKKERKCLFIELISSRVFG